MVCALAVGCAESLVFSGVGITGSSLGPASGGVLSSGILSFEGTVLGGVLSTGGSAFGLSGGEGFSDIGLST